MSGVGSQSTRSMTTCARGRPFLNGSGKRSEEQPVAATARTTVETMPIAARTVVMIRHAAPLVYRGAQYRHFHSDICLRAPAATSGCGPSSCGDVEPIDAVATAIPDAQVRQG